MQTKTFLLGMLLWLVQLLPAAWAQGTVRVIAVDDAIGPAVADLIVRNIERAAAETVELVVIQLNTPGGLDKSMRQIIKAILASPVPVATYVAPPGSRAASAGTYILYASHIAAMAPATNLGSATPVQIGGVPGMPGGAQDEPERKPTADAAPSAMEKKVVNDAAAYIRGLAELRGRNPEWAELAVREAVNLTATEALAQDVIDYLAKDLQDLLMQIDGKTVETAFGPKVLHTRIASIEWVVPDWRTQLLSVITNPNVALILMMVGIYGLFIEFSNPGFILPGVTGAISLLLGLYALQVLPVNYAGVFLALVGIAFIIAEFFIVSGGVLGSGGLIAFVIGAVILFDEPYLNISIPLIGGIALITGGFLLWLIRRFARLRRSQVVSGLDYMIGHVGRATESFHDGTGYIMIDGERWRAHADHPVRAGQAVKVCAADHLTLEVEPEETHS